MKKMKLLLGASILLIFASSAHAMLVVVEPDDFAPDQPITSPYVKVTLQSVAVGPTKPFAYAKVLDPIFPVFSANAPTGEWTFGSAAFDTGTLSGLLPIESSGFRFDFMQAVFDISLLAYQEPDGTLNPNKAEYALFDAIGNLLTTGFSSAQYGVSRINIADTPGMRTLIIGGEATTATHHFDHLRFRIDPAAVPAPAAIWLFGVGMVGLGFARRKAA